MSPTTAVCRPLEWVARHVLTHTGTSVGPTQSQRLQIPGAALPSTPPLPAVGHLVTVTHSYAVVALGYSVVTQSHTVVTVAL